MLVVNDTVGLKTEVVFFNIQYRKFSLFLCFERKRKEKIF
jgi:hypothetical protein